MQRDLFSPRKLKLQLDSRPAGPPLWVKRLVIWSEPGRVLRDIHLRPGLNVIWSPDPADRGVTQQSPAASAPGHGAGKTLLCRLLRYCLGEAQFAPSEQRSRIFDAFKDGLVGAEVVLDGVVWAVIRPLGRFGDDVVRANSTAESLINAEPTGMDPLLDALSARFAAQDVAQVLGEAPERAWLLMLAWLTRDQECRFGRLTEWRAVDSDSGSPARQLSVSAATDVVRAGLRAITSNELALATQVARLRRTREQEKQSVERLSWVHAQRIGHIAQLLGTDVAQLPEGDLLVEHLRQEAKARAPRLSLLTDEDAASSLGALVAKHEACSDEVTRLTREIEKAEGRLQTANALSAQIAKEIPGLMASLLKGETPLCPVCDVELDRGLAERCKLSHRIPDVVALKKRYQQRQEELDAQKRDGEEAQKLAEQLRNELSNAKAAREALRAPIAEASARDEAKRDARDNVVRLRDAIAEIQQLHEAKGGAEEQLRLADLGLARATEALAVERDQRGQVFIELGNHFDAIIRQLISDQSKGRVKFDAKGIELNLELGGDRSTPAIDSLKVLAFDLAAMCRSMEGATALPPLLVHDSPREADLGLSIYHDLFRLLAGLEKLTKVPLFQYIVTTTTRPPDELAVDPWLRLTLHGSPASERLLGRDL